MLSTCVIVNVCGGNYVSQNKLLINWKLVLWHTSLYLEIKCMTLNPWHLLLLDLSNIGHPKCFWDQICHINQLVIA